MIWTAHKIRTVFLQYFETKGHIAIKSAPLVVKNDPTLLFVNAGMNQFKDCFLGNEKSVYKRITDSQKCIRVSGKHNDLEEVGVDTYHHTLFEMLGNWSFGDYFKKEAIDMAWELLVKVYGINKDRIYVTVFEGNAKDKLGKDEEAFSYWAKYLNEDRILNGSKKDNFWEMGETGPCGPCSEIHIDLRNKEERAKVDGKSLVNQDHPQVIELWNLVFMEFNRSKNGDLKPLANKHIDTGMGFERLAMVLQNKQSNYDTDVFMPLIHQIEKLLFVDYGEDEKTDIAIRVIADHVRAVSFSIADGQLPSNTGAGYVIRRILRRAIRYSYSFLDAKSPFIYRLVGTLVEEMSDYFEELKAQQNLIEKIIKEEEASFLKTLEKGIKKFDTWVATKQTTMDGNVAFELYDTFGFPIDLTQLLASEKNLKVDMQGFNKCLEEQKNRSRNATKIDLEDWVIVTNDNETVNFVGYYNLEITSHIIKYRKVNAKDKERYQLVLSNTCFYPEGGGQVGDTGVLIYDNEQIDIIDTKKENNLILHISKSLPTALIENCTVKVDAIKRRLTECNHSATHLLHKALRDTLGTHVEQKGSLVNANNLRFDFSHFQKITPEEIATIEAAVNTQIRNAVLLEENQKTNIDDAKAMGAMALFGEKYGDKVRVIKFSDSVELCGGCHVKNTSYINRFKIISEGSVAAGIRRIEAVTSLQADAYFDTKLHQLNEIENLLKNPKNAIKVIQGILKESTELKKKLDKLNALQAKEIQKQLFEEAELINGVKVIAQKVDLDMSVIKNLAFSIKKESNILLVLGSENNGKANLTVAISEDLSIEKKLNAGEIIRELAKEINGGGGGQAHFASAGGSNTAGIDNALLKAKELV